MPQINIPPLENKRWSGIYKGSYFGTVYKTFNVDLDANEGKVVLSRIANKITDSGSLTTLRNVTNVLRTNADNTDRWWALSDNNDTTGSKMYKSSGTAIDTGWDTDALANSPVDARDMCIHENDSDDEIGENRLVVSRQTDISMLNRQATNAWDNGWWVTTLSQAALKTGIPHPVDVFNRLLIIGDGNYIHTVDKNNSVSNKKITLPFYLQIEHIFHTKNRVWILASHKFSGFGSIVEWDGYSSTYNNDHSCYSTTPLSGIDWNGIPIIVNDRGQILEYSGSGFIPMIRNGQVLAFPVNSELDNAAKTGAQVSIRPRGMTVSDMLIYINVGSFTNASFRQNAGIWCLDPMKGRLYHKYSIGQNGSAVDFGQQEIDRPGTIVAIPNNLTTTSFLIGGRVYDVYSGTVLSGLWNLQSTTSTTANRGYFVTNYIPTDQAEMTWETLWLKHKKIFTSTDRIVIKAKGANSLQTATGLPIDKTITWASTTTFTVTLAATDDELAVGDEVEILAGDNAGFLAHISTITGAHAALQTIKIDETTTSSTSAALARFDRWKKLGTISSTTSYRDTFNIGIDSPFIQIKVGMYGLGKEIEIDEIIINPEINIKSKR